MTETATSVRSNLGVRSGNGGMTGMTAERRSDSAGYVSGGSLPCEYRLDAAMS
jgi:hypothetical protein